MKPERNRQQYALEHMLAAVNVLATHPAGIKLRLKAAAQHFQLVDPESLPSGIRRRYRLLMADMNRLTPNPEKARSKHRPYGVTRMDHTLASIWTKTAVKLARRMVGLTSEFEYLLADD